MPLTCKSSRLRLSKNTSSRGSLYNYRMGEEVGIEDGYCRTAEDAMDLAGQHNAAAGSRSRRLSPDWSRYPKIKVDVDDLIVKTHRSIAYAADSMVRGVPSAN